MWGTTDSLGNVGAGAGHNTGWGAWRNVRQPVSLREVTLCASSLAVMGGTPRAGALSDDDVELDTLNGDDVPLLQQAVASLGSIPKTLVALVILNAFFGSVAGSFSGPFLPGILQKRDYSPAVTGLIIGCNPLLCVLTFPLAPSICTRFGRRRVYATGILLQTSACFCAAFIPEHALLLLLPLFAVGGAGVALCNTSLLGDVGARLSKCSCMRSRLLPPRSSSPHG